MAQGGSISIDSLMRRAIENSTKTGLSCVPPHVPTFSKYDERPATRQIDCRAASGDQEIERSLVMWRRTIAATGAHLDDGLGARRVPRGPRERPDRAFLRRQSLTDIATLSEAIVLINQESTQGVVKTS